MDTDNTLTPSLVSHLAMLSQTIPHHLHMSCHVEEEVRYRGSSKHQEFIYLLKRDKELTDSHKMAFSLPETLELPNSQEHT